MGSPDYAKGVAFFLYTAILASILFVGGCGTRKVSKNYKPVLSNDVVKTAYSQMGTKYRSGGVSPEKGFDCSGLVWWVYNRHGVDVPRMTTHQAKTGRYVNKNKMKPGDITVFKIAGTPNGLHTGIYTGNGTFIHSPKPGQRVRMESVEIPYWQTKLVGARRVLDK